MNSYATHVIQLPANKIPPDSLTQTYNTERPVGMDVTASNNKLSLYFRRENKKFSKG